ncbi:MAG: class I SAM-dependent methyltransferase [Erysipelotrichaceae bacterium]|nr:class I SAM-dependent methyltransferase [Erysipelotrichaceae bacterium]MDY5252567.1 class I SAM-dependent methyltransferase [Erysipelotrichaceae bacterium]
MSFYFEKANVEQYKAMMKDYDNSFVISEFKKSVLIGSKVLELGMGIGLDLLALSKDYNVIGSDQSPLFVEDFQHEHPDHQVIVCDARDFKLDEKFDCIYSNKVLYHLNKQEFVVSLSNQAQHLKANGIIFMTLWNGDHREDNYEDLIFTYYRADDIYKLLPTGLSVERMLTYSEMEKDNSLLVVLRKQ